jgi:hypothetical protein
MLYQRVGRHCHPVAEIGNVSSLGAGLGKRIRDPAHNRTWGIGLVEETFHTAIWPVLFSNRQTSVKVPLESTPIHNAMGQPALAAALPAI